MLARKSLAKTASPSIRNRLNYYNIVDTKYLFKILKDRSEFCRDLENMHQQPRTVGTVTEQVGNIISRKQMQLCLFIFTCILFISTMIMQCSYRGKLVILLYKMPRQNYCFCSGTKKVASEQLRSSWERRETFRMR